MRSPCVLGINERPRDDQADRGDDHQARLRRRLGAAGAAQGPHRQEESPSSARARPAWPLPSNSTGPATGSPCSSAPTASADCSATASPNSRWRRRSSTAASRQMEAEGVKFRPNANVGVNVTVDELKRTSTPSSSPAARPCPATSQVPGRELKGIHFAMEFLPQQNKGAAKATPSPNDKFIPPRASTSSSSAAATPAPTAWAPPPPGRTQVHQFEILPRPPTRARPNNPWPQWPNIYRTNSATRRAAPRLRDRHQALHRRERRPQEAARHPG